VSESQEGAGGEGDLGSNHDSLWQSLLDLAFSEVWEPLVVSLETGREIHDLIGEELSVG
jgi:hypothetical protein